MCYSSDRPTSPSPSPSPSGASPAEARRLRGWHLAGHYAIEVSHSIELRPESDAANYFGGRKPSGWCATRDDGIPAKIAATVRVVRDADAVDGQGLVLEVDAVRRVIVRARNNRSGEGIAAAIGEGVLRLLGADPWKGLVELSVRLGNGNDVVEWRATPPAKVVLAGDPILGAEEGEPIAGLPGLPAEVLASGGSIAALAAWLHASIGKVAADLSALREQVNETAAATRAIEDKVIPDDFDDDDGDEDGDFEDEVDCDEDEEEVDCDEDEVPQPYSKGTALRVTGADAGVEVGQTVYFDRADCDGDLWIARSRTKALQGLGFTWVPPSKLAPAETAPWAPGSVAVAREGNGSRLGAGDPFVVFEGPDADGHVLALPLVAETTSAEEPDPDLAFWIPAADLEPKTAPTFEPGAKVKIARLAWRFRREIAGTVVFFDLPAGGDSGLEVGQVATVAPASQTFVVPGDVMIAEGGDGGWYVSPWALEPA